MLVKAYSAAVNGLEVTTITVEVSLTRGVSYRLTGLATRPCGRAATALRQLCSIRV